MSSDPFELLGLDYRTATDADVRRAYAERLKVTRPEDDRDAFMALRAAFERARVELQWRSDDEEFADGDDEAQVVPQSVEATAEAIDTAVAEYQEDADEADSEDEYVYEPTPEEAAFDARLKSAMDALVDVLTGSPFGPAPAKVREVIEREEVSGIEEYQAMQWQVRQLLCDRTGMHLEPPQLRLPDWLTLAVFDQLDSYYGWTRQPTTNGYVRRLNDWLASVRKDVEIQALPKADRKKHELQRALGEMDLGGPAPQTNDDRLGWRILARLIFRIPFIIVGYFIWRAVANGFGG